jgi:hypothetical protein
VCLLTPFSRFVCGRTAFLHLGLDEKGKACSVRFEIQTSEELDFADITLWAIDGVIRASRSSFVHKERHSCQLAVAKCSASGVLIGCSARIIAA